VLYIYNLHSAFAKQLGQLSIPC